MVIFQFISDTTPCTDVPSDVKKLEAIHRKFVNEMHQLFLTPTKCDEDTTTTTSISPDIGKTKPGKIPAIVKKKR